MRNYFFQNKFFISRFFYLFPQRLLCLMKSKWTNLPKVTYKILWQINLQYDCIVSKNTCFQFIMRNIKKGNKESLNSKRLRKLHVSLAYNFQYVCSCFSYQQFPFFSFFFNKLSLLSYWYSYRFWKISKNTFFAEHLQT